MALSSTYRPSLRGPAEKLQAEGLDDRAPVIAGDRFVGMQPADVNITSTVPCGWNDESATPVPAGNRPETPDTTTQFTKFMKVTILSMGGGRERTDGTAHTHPRGAGNRVSLSRGWWAPSTNISPSGHVGRDECGHKCRPIGSRGSR
jgi:hypothetical protein